MAISYAPLEQELAKRATARRGMASMSDRGTIALEGIYDELTKLNAVAGTMLIKKK